MQTRFRPVFVALASLFAVNSALAQAPAPAPRPAPKPAAKPAAAAAAPAPAAAPAAPAEPAAAPEGAAEAGDEAAEPAEPAAGEPTVPAPTAPNGSPATRPAPTQVLPAFPEPVSDAAALQQMGKQRPAAARPKEEVDVYADDWWSHARPILEIHGNFRLRAEMFYRFSLGRNDPPGNPMWSRPPDGAYRPYEGSDFSQELCTQDEAGSGSSTSTDSLVGCKNNTQAGANLRFRLNPEIHVSDNLRVISQIDILDNVVLGSTSSGYSVTPPANRGSELFGVSGRNGYEPVGFLGETTTPPRSGINSLSDSIHVKRVWGEYSTPVGQLRFGRMPNHWGLGLVNHSGDGYDDDYQSTIDRIQFVAGIKPLDLFVSAAWDFPSEGPTSAVLASPGAQPYDLAQLDDVDQYTFSVARRKSYELTKLALTRGDLVLNGGVQLTYRQQLLAADCQSPCPGSNATPFQRRDAHYWLPDLWLQLLYKQFRFEAEAATIQGSIHNASSKAVFIDDPTKYKFSSFGFAGEIEQLLLENRLHLGMHFGWAQGDADVDGFAPDATSQTFGQLGEDRTISTFRFNPGYRVDMILWRNIMSRVQGAYYFRPSLGYDFIREPTGQRLGGTVAGIWSRASEFIQAPGHDRDLGIELNGALYFQSKDGALNDDPTRMGGFYTRLEYGILFPMAGLGYPAARAAAIRNQGFSNPSTSSAQILRWYLGVMF